jgi:tetratricopeptide (TPR) repeat protein/predicted aspartyl protease
VNECIEGSGRWARASRRRWGRSGPAAVAVALALAASPAAGATECRIGSLELPVTMLGTRAIATVGINGTDVPMMVDTGAFFSFLTPAAAEQLRLPVAHAAYGLRVRGLTGEVETGTTTVKQLHLVRGDVPDVEFLVGGNEPGAGAMGVIGRNLLAFGDAEYDLSHGVIRLVLPRGDCADMDTAYWAGTTPVSTLDLLRDKTRKTPAIRAVVKINGLKVKALFDSGATTLISLDAAHRAGIADADMTPAGDIGGAGRGRVKSWTAPVQRVEIGGETIENNRLRIADIDGDNEMLLGIDFFLSHHLYVSRGRHRMDFTYNGGPVFELSKLPPPERAASAAAADVAADETLDASGYARRGAASAARHDFAHALQDLDRACALAPQDAANFTRRGVVHEALRQHELALADFDHALELDPGQHEARIDRASRRVERGDRDGAIADLETLDRMLAPQAPLRLRVAGLYVRLDLMDRALPQWDRWIAAHREDEGLPEVLNARCRARAMLAVDLDKAVADCDEAVDRRDGNASFVDSRGWLRLRRGELRKAIADFDRALRLKPDEAWSLYGRGQARIRQGEAGPGNADVAAARRLAPDIDERAGRYGFAAPVAASASAAVDAR